ncbi:hypothetical protein SAMN05444401_2346 [Clostridium amylolyticum]|uniref:Yip1 domain-containing protein n=1 Tax=Clostridium amylolyticum TaxID=1121298 RepID=A0A1M6H2M6_9CLOT|nr:hypothetical protein [Clostridium amylolyticum]SHJ16463.1 hypothetical protein SAMN05444401_2346 [Clostridium amylolyticum]
MTLLEEFKISITKPQHYSKLKNQSLLKIFRFQLLTSIVGIIILFIAQFIKSLFFGGIGSFISSYKNISIPYLLGTILYMWIGIVFTALILSIIFYAFSYFKASNNLSFKDVYNYIAHSLIVCALVAPFMGPFVIFIVISIYVYATKTEKINA